jgi:cell division protein FtsW
MSVFARALDVQQETRAAPWAGRALFVLTIILLGLGLLWLYSASSFVATSEGLPSTYYLVQQSTHAGVGLVGLAAARLIDYRIWRRLAWPLLILSVILLVIVILPGTEALAPRVNGARRWLRLGMTVQPSELAKYALVVWVAAVAVKKQDRLHSMRYGLGPFLLVAGCVCGLLLLEPHFSAALLTAAVTVIVLFAAGARLGHFALMAGFGLPLAWVVVTHAGYRSSRISAFLHPSPGAQGVGYQLRQSLIAVGSGGLFGVGYGASRQKLYYLPEPQNDFIFPIIAEEWGLVGSVVVIGLFLAWTLVALRIAASAPDLFGRLLAVGITALIAVTAFGHIGVTLGVLPTTGINLPFVSAGGTHLVMALFGTGILLNIAAQRRC